LAPATAGIVPESAWSRAGRGFDDIGDLQMSKKFELLAEDRTDMGKGASRRLRRDNKVPAVLYGGHREPRALTLDHELLTHHLENEAFYSSILTVTVGDKSQPCVVKDIQRHPARPRVMHMDLQRVLEDEEIKVRVPVHFLGEDRTIGVKDQGGAISHLMTEIEVSCLPRYLPEYIEVDVATLELDQSITLSEIPLPEGVSIPQLAQGEEFDQPVVAVQRIKAVVIEPEEGEEAEEESAEVPTVKEDEEDQEPSGD
jgi:large subunit ribosomal protein L25